MRNAEENRHFRESATGESASTGEKAVTIIQPRTRYICEMLHMECEPPISEFDRVGSLLVG